MCIRDRSNTSEPSFKNSIAVAFPIPPAPPVIIATLLSNFFIIEIHYEVSFTKSLCGGNDEKSSFSSPNILSGLTESIAPMVSLGSV